ncbi:DUF6074 family protein [Devosia sp. ZB163]|uniref:DUF6074 family protein n=1 Tax=Devosia sp. ZB163 TaxID=3025938 RepID=UPI00235FF764|nr:DUF6074 family protein [Devosia sp. ZB163]MDC9822965.1 DUF6074 family protein [Devosia sp. ZB163]
MSDQLDLFCNATRIAEGRLSAPPSLPVGSPATPTLVILPFPMKARIGNIRDVATKLIATKSVPHAESYRALVTEGLIVHLRSKRVAAELHAAEVHRFWQAVDIEIVRRLDSGRRPGGGAA